MKKIIVVAVVLLGMNTLIAQVQDESKSKLKKASFGLKGGLNVANLALSGDGAPSTSALTSFHIGAFAEIMLNKKLAFQPELLYSAQGAKFDFLFIDEIGAYQTENTFKLNYVNIPLMLKYYPQDNLFFEVGPQISFLSSAKLKVQVDGLGSDEQDAKEIFKEIDFSLGFGLGYNFSNELVVNVRYNIGLTNIADTEPGDNSEIKNSVFAVSLGYKFK